jgi:outer membrane protein OmpA-like peptidoglycan-associated protein
MLRNWVGLLSLAVVLLLASEGRADPDRLGVVFNSLVSGRDMPGVVIRPKEAVRSLTIRLTRDDGRRSTLRAAGVAAGTKRSLAVRQEVGKHGYRGKFNVTWGSGDTSEFELAFELTRVGKLKLFIKAEDVDLDARVLRFKISNPAERAELHFVGQDGKTIKTLTKKFDGAPGGTTLELSWPPLSGDLLYLQFKVYDIAGFWTGKRVDPFWIDIPHDDVEFESGKWEIRKREELKLSATMTLIREALRKHGTLLQLKLFIAGYTDTVGSHASNQTLSNNRARAIAQWYRQHGLRIPIYFQGFGEEVLAKPTPDETDEPANRRAAYILSSQQPKTNAAIPRSRWRAL